LVLAPLGTEPGQDVGIHPQGDLLLDRAVEAPPCVFHAKVDTDSTASWTVIPRQAGHLFQGKLDT
jgi:hypothetical protein